MANTDTTQIMGIRADTYAEADLADADFYALAVATHDEDGQYVSHCCLRGEYATFGEAVAALCNDYEGDNIWQDVIYPLADEVLTDQVDTGRNDCFTLEFDGSTVEFDAQRNEWAAR